MEKNGEIREDCTPSEQKDCSGKCASAADLEAHLTKRTADHTKDCCRKAPVSR